MNLITGATGLIGAHVALQLLQHNKPVVAIKRKDSDLSKTQQLFSYYTPDFENLFHKITWIDGDITDIYSILDALKDIETVYHCAGFVSFNAKYRAQMHAVNVLGTANMVNACLEKNIKALCYVSSIATLQNPDVKSNINESISWKYSPRVSDYALSKYNGEREVWRGIEEGLNAVIVNPGLVIGPGFWNQSSGKLISTCYKRTPFYTNGSSAAVSANDTAICMIKLVEAAQFGKRFIVTGSNYTFKELLSMVHKALGKKEPTMEAGLTLLTLGKWLDAFKCRLTGTEQIITEATINAALEKNTFSNKRIIDVLNYNFTPLNEAVQFACNAYINDLKNNNV